MPPPITEQSNTLSHNIDVATPKDIASILYKCDKEIFDGWQDSKGVNDPQIVDQIHKIAGKISQVCENPSGCVIISGCGTSGRLSFLTARTFNRYLKSQGKRECFQYLIGGSDEALFRSLELGEDDPVSGAQVLKQASEGKRAIVYIGVTCGLSAPFVAGQLDYCLSHLDVYTPVLLGFNPVHQARNIEIEKWDKTFLQVAQTLEETENSSQGFILNPLIGPEPITGSSRMKSGTTTRILLEILSLVAVQRFPKERIPQLISMYEASCHSVYKCTQSLGSLIQLAGDSVTSNGHVYYLGCDGFGLMGMIDASECPPTYGASYEDIRGFVDGGFRQLDNNEGDISDVGPGYLISIEDFTKEVLPAIQLNDTVILLGEDVLVQVQANISKLPCKKAAVFIGLTSQKKSVPQLEGFDEVVSIDLDIPALTLLSPDPAREIMSQLVQEVALKWVVNNISTGAYILKGKVYQNTMIDVRVSNNKLFHRAVGIVQKYCRLSEQESTEYLLKSVYETDTVTEEQRAATVKEHIVAASERQMVVPKAILMASLCCTVETAKDMIQREPGLRKLIASEVQK